MSRASRKALDLLGQRLIQDPVDIADLRMLSAYRNEIREHTEQTLLIIRAFALARRYPVTDRPEKSLPSIRRKLRDTTIGLGDMDDLVGVRVTVPDRKAQSNSQNAISKMLPDTRWIDRRASPSSGYRALHAIRREEGYPVEIQIRTRLQDAWANLSESLADRLHDQSIKYGGGPPELRELLDGTSGLIQEFELLEANTELESIATPNHLPNLEIDDLREFVSALSRRVTTLDGFRTTLAEHISNLERAYT